MTAWRAEPPNPKAKATSFWTLELTADGAVGDSYGWTRPEREEEPLPDANTPY